MASNRQRIWATTFAAGATSLCWLLPFSTLPWLVAFLVAVSAVIALYRRNFDSIAGEMLLMAVAMVLIVGVAVDVAQFCPDGDFENPTLANPDSYRLFTAALQLYNGEEITVIMAYRGIPALLSAIWHITGITIFAPLLLSVLLARSIQLLQLGSMALKHRRQRPAHHHTHIGDRELQKQALVRK